MPELLELQMHLCNDCKQSLSKEAGMDFVLGELKKGRGTQFDPQLTDIMLHLIETGQIDMQRLYDNANVKEEEE